MTASISFSTHNASSLVDCDQNCGNMTHPSIPTCGDCLDEGFTVDNRNQRAIVSTRRFFNSGYGN